MNTIANSCLTSALCLSSGYVLNKVVNSPPTKKDDPTQKLDISKYLSKEKIEESKNLKVRSEGGMLYTVSFGAIQEEVLFRFLVERVVLPFFFPAFEAFSMARTFTTSLLFAAVHLTNMGSPEALIRQFINTAILGTICSLAQEIFGLLGAICIHLGYNLHAWQLMFNKSFPETLDCLRKTTTSDAIKQMEVLKQFSK